MKLTKEVLRALIRETIKENKSNSMLLSEAEVSLSVDELMSQLNVDPDKASKAKLQRIGIMTAENPRGMASSPALNAQKMAEFKKELDASGVDYVSMGGKYGGEENSVFILNPSKQDIIKYGKKYKQAAVIFGQRLVRNYRPDQPSAYFRIDYYQTEPDGNEEPDYDPQEYYLIDSRDMIVADAAAQQRDDYYSEIGGKKFFIPFFSDDASHAMSDEPGAQAASREM